MLAAGLCPHDGHMVWMSSDDLDGESEGVGVNSYASAKCSSVIGNVVCTWPAAELTVRLLLLACGGGRDETGSVVARPGGSRGSVVCSFAAPSACSVAWLILRQPMVCVQTLQLWVVCDLLASLAQRLRTIASLAAELGMPQR